MTGDGFWDIVERVHAGSPDDMRRKCSLLQNELTRLPLAEVLSFEEHFGDCYMQANTWDIWGAAYLIHRGCSDDGFMDFRSTLISLGRGPFEAALANADSLAGFDIDSEWACFEGYQYVASKVYREVHKYEPPERVRDIRYSDGPRGEPFDEEEMTPRFPRLVAKFHHRDTDPDVLRAKRVQKKRFEEASERVREILLKGVIPASGLVPPPRIVSQVLRTGRSPESSGRKFQWEPIELDEGNFWTALFRLERPAPDDLNCRPDLEGKRVVLDTGCGDVNDYDGWISSLIERGLQRVN